MSGNRILYREVKSYEDAYRYNSENEAAKEMNSDRYSSKGYNYNDSIEIKSTKTKEDSSIVSTIFNGIVEVAKVLVNLLDDFS